MNRLPLRLGFLLNALVLAVAWLALSQLANAQCPQICDGLSNTALGTDALVNNINGGGNTAIGFHALLSNTSSGNTATGNGALLYNTVGGENTATGAGALSSNTIGIANTATGFLALYFNTEGANNTAIGLQALYSNTTGLNNTATGNGALVHNTTGKNNTATGASALARNTTGDSNIALGYQAGASLTTGGNNIDIGNRGGVERETNTIRLGTQGTQNTTFIAGISGATVPTGVAVIVDSDGHLGTTTSAARFKEAIKPMDNTSESILALKPVTFRYKHELDPDGIPQFGLVAEDVEKVNPDLVARDEQGKPYTVRYEAVNAMLLNEFLKEHRKVQEENATITQLKANVAKQDARAERQEGVVAQQQKQIEALTAGLQKVSAQLEIMKPTPQTVSNNY